MKKLIIAVLSLTLVTFTFTGCKTTTNPSGIVTIGNVQIDPVTTGKTVRLVAKLGAAETIRSKPESRTYFQLSVGVISAAIAAGEYDPVALQASLDTLTKDKLVSSGITDALSIYKDFFGTVTAAKFSDKSPYTIPVLQGLVAGLNDALIMTAP